MRILMLHGSRQSGDLFRAKLQGLEKAIQRATGQGKNHDIELVYPTAPSEIETPKTTSDLRARHGAWSWFQTESIEGTYPGLDDALESVATTLKASGPFDGVIGFSQGAALASMVASLLDPHRQEVFTRSEGSGMQYPTSFANIAHPPLKFAVIISGYVASDPTYRAFYEPGIRTPALHILGSMDNVVDEEESLSLLSCYSLDGKDPMVVRHMGGHIVPSGKRELAVIAQFIKSSLS